MTDVERYQRAKQIFHEACDLDASERAAFLIQACDGDENLRREIAALLAQQDEDTSVLQGIAAQAEDDPAARLIGERIGRYQIVRVIAIGGMGAVYEAIQDDPHRAVALKIIKPGILSKETLRRFEHESAILGRLSHPGIAQIFEAGTFDLGAGPQPYFAMEYIEGSPLDKHLAESSHSVRELLELMCRICHAIDHAHSKGVIHRDLKPGNILVDKWGQPKVLDFGVARAEGDLRATTLNTGVGRFIGTVAYMSPEQAAGKPDEIDEKSDIYSLGVICYELLTGRLPYDLDGEIIYEAARIVRDEPPTPLSSINRSLRGDLETIVAKALEKEKPRRYQSAVAMAEDIERFLRQEPIKARPPSTWYQTRKFAARNRGLVTGVLAVFGVLIAGMLVSGMLYVQTEAARQETATERDRALQAEALAEQQRLIAEENEQRAVQEAERALLAEAEAKQRAEELEQVAEFQATQLAGIDTVTMGMQLRATILDRQRNALEDLGREADQVVRIVDELNQSLAGVNFTNVAQTLLEDQILDRTLDAIDEQFQEQPLVRARLLETTANTMRGIGLFERAVPLHEEVLRIRREHLGNEQRPTLVALQNLGVTLYLAGRNDEAKSSIAVALDAMRRVLGDENPDTLTARGSLGSVLQAMRLYDEAEVHLRAVLKVRQRKLGANDPLTLSTMNNLAVLLEAQGRLREAEPYFTQVVEGRQLQLGENHRDTLLANYNLGGVLFQQGKAAEAEPYLLAAMAGHRQTLGDEHPRTLRSISSVGQLLQSQGRLAEAEEYLRMALRISERVLGYDERETLHVLATVGLVLTQQGKLDEAEQYARKTLELRRRVLGPDHPETLAALSNVGSLLREQERFEEAEPFGAEAVKVARRTMPGHPAKALFIAHHAQTLYTLNRVEEAEEMLLEAYGLLEPVLGPNHMQTARVANSLVQVYERRHESEPDAGHDVRAEHWRAKLPEPVPGES